MTVPELLPPVLVCATTYFPEGRDGARRRASAERAIESWRRNLKYQGDLYLHIADDGSERSVLAGLRTPYWRRFIATQQARHGVGASLNATIDIMENEDLAILLYAVDDWALTQQFDLTPWVRILMERTDIGMIRLGPAHPDLTGQVEHFGPEFGVHLERHHYAFGHRPALYHFRMFAYYGRFAEDCSAWECERLYNEAWCAERDERAPGIVLALPSPWAHVGDVEIGDIDPSAAGVPA